MSEKLIKILDESECPSADALAAYLDDILPSQEKQIVEKHLAYCEMCNDELEGMSLLKDNSLTHKYIKEIKQEIHSKLIKKQSRVIPLYQKIAVAASFLLIVGIGIIWILNQDKSYKQDLAQGLDKSTEMQAPGTSEIELNIREDQKIDKSPSNQILAENERITNTKKAEGRKMVIKEKTITSGTSEGILKVAEDKIINETTPVLAEEKMGENAVTNVERDENQNVVTIGDKKKIAGEHTKSKDITVNVSSSSGPEVYTMTGRVLDKKTGQPISGVNIFIDGTKGNTTTDPEGKYTIELPEPKVDLVFSIIGYESQKVKTNNLQEMDIALLTKRKKSSENAPANLAVASDAKKDQNLRSKSEYSDLEENISDDITLNKSTKPSGISDHDEKTLLNKALEFINHSKVDSALIFYNLILKSKPDCPQALLGSSYCFLNAGKTNEALEKINYLIKVSVNKEFIDKLNQAKQFITEKNNSKALDLIRRMMD